MDLVQKLTQSYSLGVKVVCWFSLLQPVAFKSLNGIKLCSWTRAYTHTIPKMFSWTRNGLKHEDSSKSWGNFFMRIFSLYLVHKKIKMKWTWHSRLKLCMYTTWKFLIYKLVNESYKLKCLWLCRMRFFLLAYYKNIRNSNQSADLKFIKHWKCIKCFWIFKKNSLLWLLENMILVLMTPAMLPVNPSTLPTSNSVVATGIQVPASIPAGICVFCFLANSLHNIWIYICTHEWIYICTHSNRMSIITNISLN